MSLRILRSWLFSPIAMLILFSLLLALAIWYLGPLLAIGDVRPFDALAGRLIGVAALIALTTIAILSMLLRRRARAAAITEAISENAATPDHREDATAAELQEMQARMAEALAVLRRSKTAGRFGFSARHLYQLPWYVIIGPPGAGKTTAIVNSGLKFPLAERFGKSAIGGVGGTRNCDWWFTDEAVLLDTAGRYTTQDSDGEADAKGWLGFLDMLKKHRSRQPINGALVAISLSDLSTQDERTRKDHASAVRLRLHELQERLGVAFPVYVIFTKADLIAGFQEFFEDLGAAEREQVWGFTLPLAKERAGKTALSGFRTAFDGLAARLGDQSLERMQAETDYQRRSLIQAFPAQIVSLRDTAEAFLQDVFQENRFESKQLLRGVYFTSGTQEGSPIDRLMTGMARIFGIGRQAIGAGKGQGRSYFLTKLMNDVIFPEAGLVSADDKVERRYRWTVRAVAAAAVLAFAGFAAIWANSYGGNSALIENAQDKVEEFRGITAGVPQNPVADSDIASVAPALNILRDLPGNPAAGDPEPALALTFGLYQGDAVGTESAQSYRAALNSLLLPRLIYRLEEQLQANLNNPDLLFEALKVYLMLGLQGPMDEDLVKTWMGIDWSLIFPGRERLVADLEGHLEELLNQPMREIALNGPLVEQIQGLLSETPLAERVYQSIVKGPAARALPLFRLTDIGGPAVARVLLRPSGNPLSDGIEGIYTRSGFHGHVLPEAFSVAERVHDESWALGPRGAAETGPNALALLSRDVLNLYYTDYIGRYDQLLADIDIAPMESLSHATEVLNVLSGPSSPLAAILKAVSKETKLTRPALQDAVAAAANSGAAGAAGGDGTNRFSGLNATGQALFDVITAATAVAGTGDGADEKPGAVVEERFADLHAFVDGVNGAPSKLDDTMAAMVEVYNELNRLSLGQDTGAAIAGQGGGAAARLEARIGRLSGPMQRWVSQVAAGSSGVAIGGARAELNARWQSQVLPFCQKALSGRYPFDRQARADVPLQDFARLFEPGGLIDVFFKESLLAFVDTTSNPWRWKRLNGKDLGISEAVLAQFQRAGDIRDSFFQGSGQPSVAFDLTPVALDPTVEEAIIEIEGRSVAYAHGPPRATLLAWPGEGAGRNRVLFKPEQPQIENTIARDGPWGFFRLLDAAERRRANIADRNHLRFNIGGRIATYELRAASVLNPFDQSVTSGFRCPTSL